MSSSPLSLSSFKIPVGGGSAPFTGGKSVVIHRQAHGTTRLPPFETRLDENFVQTFLFRLFLDQAGTGNDHRELDVFGPFFSLNDSSGGSQIFNT